MPKKSVIPMSQRITEPQPENLEHQGRPHEILYSDLDAGNIRVIGSDGIVYYLDQRKRGEFTLRVYHNPNA